MDIKHRELKDNGFFIIEVEGEVLGEMSYRRSDNTHITINHTEVDDRLRGKGAGKQLLSKAVSWARENNIKVKATCTFAESLFQTVTEFQDVWEKR